MTMKSITFADCCFLSIPQEGYRLTWEITQFCPKSCEYCFTWSSPKREKFERDINCATKKVQILINELRIQDVLITGGEPLSILDEIIPFLSFFNHDGKSFSFSSNLYDEELFSKLCRFRPRTINLSIDPPTQNIQRSSFKASYDSIKKKLDMVKLKGIPLKITAVITRSNYKGIGELLEFLSPEFLSKYPNIKKIAFNREYPLGHAAESKPQTRGELEKAFHKIENWAQMVSVPISMVNWDVFHSPLQACPAGKNIISIMPNCDVTPCSLLYNLTRSFRIGNILNDPIADILDRLKIFTKEMEKYNEIAKSNTSSCSSCQKQHICGGGCPAMLPIASNHISRRTCEFTQRRLKDHERRLLSDFHHNFHIGYSPNLRTFVAPETQLSDDIERKMRHFVNRNIKPTDLAHTMEHIDCVVVLAKFIAKKEGASLKITIPAAYFHDISPREPAMHHMHTFKSALIAKNFLRKTGLFTEEEIIHIQYCIYTSSYGSYLLGYQPLSLEAKVVRDADWLDAIGARGIARVFAFGQAHGAESIGYPDMDPEGFKISIDMNITGPDKNPIDHFFKKLLKIYSLLQTATARELGRKRHEIMVEFLNQYREEVDTGKDSGRQLQIRFNQLPSDSGNK